jgi:hypothetical protein
LGFVGEGGGVGGNDGGRGGLSGCLPFRPCLVSLGCVLEYRGLGCLLEDEGALLVLLFLLVLLPVLPHDEEEGVEIVEGGGGVGDEVEGDGAKD